MDKVTVLETGRLRDWGHPWLRDHYQLGQVISFPDFEDEILIFEG